MLQYAAKCCKMLKVDNSVKKLVKSAFFLKKLCKK